MSKLFGNIIIIKSKDLKHSQLIGTLIAILIIILSHLPWSIVVEKHLIIGGMNAEGTNFGRPGLLNIILSVLMIILFNIPKVWAKRTNLFVGAINFAWSIRNYLLVTTCFFGECPQKLSALYFLVVTCFSAMLMTFFPKMEIEKEA